MPGRPGVSRWSAPARLDMSQQQYMPGRPGVSEQHMDDRPSMSRRYTPGQPAISGMERGAIEKILHARRSASHAHYSLRSSTLATRTAQRLLYACAMRSAYSIPALRHIQTRYDTQTRRETRTRHARSAGDVAWSPPHDRARASCTTRTCTRKPLQLTQ